MKLSEEYAKFIPKPKYEFGTRVFGYYKNIPFIGTTGADNLTSELLGPQVSILLDLPMNIDGKQLSVIRVSYSDIKSVLKRL